MYHLLYICILYVVCRCISVSGPYFLCYPSPTCSHGQGVNPCTSHLFVTDIFVVRRQATCILTSAQMSDSPFHTLNPSLCESFADTASLPYTLVLLGVSHHFTSQSRARQGARQTFPLSSLFYNKGDVSTRSFFCST